MGESPASPQLCPVAGCPNHQKPGQLMCRDHWFAVPAAQRRAHMRVFRTWQASRRSSDIREVRAAGDALRQSMDACVQAAGGRRS